MDWSYYGDSVDGGKVKGKKAGQAGDFCLESDSSSLDRGVVTEAVRSGQILGRFSIGDHWIYIWFTYEV